MPSSGTDSPVVSWTLRLWRKADRKSGICRAVYPSREGDITFTRWAFLLSASQELVASALADFVSCRSS